MLAQPATARRIGPWGTAARVVGGAAMLAGAAVLGIDAFDALVGLVVFPLAVSAVLAVRGWDAPPLRFTGPAACCLVCALGAAGFILVPEAAFLFLATGMLIAGVRGDAGCELSAVSNLLRRREDEIACPVFDPIDAPERRAEHREVAT